MQRHCGPKRGHPFANTGCPVVQGALPTTALRCDAAVSLFEKYLRHKKQP